MLFFQNSKLEKKVNLYICACVHLNEFLNVKEDTRKFEEKGKNEKDMILTDKKRKGIFILIFIKSKKKKKETK